MFLLIFVLYVVLSAFLGHNLCDFSQSSQTSFFVCFIRYVFQLCYLALHDSTIEPTCLSNICEQICEMHVRLCLAKHKHTLEQIEFIWQHMSIWDNIWVTMGVSERIQLHLTKHDQLTTKIRKYQQTRANMKRSEHI